MILSFLRNEGTFGMFRELNDGNKLEVKLTRF